MSDQQHRIGAAPRAVTVTGAGRPLQGQWPVPVPWQPTYGRIVVHCGLPGAGKTTAAQYELDRAVAQSLTAMSLDKDAVDTAVITLLNNQPGGRQYDVDDRDSAVYCEQIYPGVMELMGQGVMHALGSGYDLVIVDAPLLAEARAAEEAGMGLSELLVVRWGLPAHVEIETVWHTATSEYRRDAMRRRGAPRDAAKLADWSAYEESLEAMLPSPDWLAHFGVGRVFDLNGND